MRVRRRGFFVPCSRVVIQIDIKTATISLAPVLNHKDKKVQGHQVFYLKQRRVKIQLQQQHAGFFAAVTFHFQVYLKRQFQANSV